jgi:hypothetical protein
MTRWSALFLAVLAAQALAQPDEKVERERKKIVFRTCQLLETGHRFCPKAAAPERQRFKVAHAKLRTGNAEFYRLFRASPYFVPAQADLATLGDLPPVGGNSQEACEATLWLLEGMVNTPEGKKVLDEYAALLRK